MRAEGVERALKILKDERQEYNQAVKEMSLRLSQRNQEQIDERNSVKQFIARVERDL